jgi:hypothetical protein
LFTLIYVIVSGLFQGNPVLVEKMIDNIFRSQPSYEGDLSKSASSMGSTMLKTVDNLEAMIHFSNCDSPTAQEGLIDLVTYATGKLILK